MALPTSKYWRVARVQSKVRPEDGKIELSVSHLSKDDIERSLSIIPRAFDRHVEFSENGNLLLDAPAYYIHCIIGMCMYYLPNNRNLARVDSNGRALHYKAFPLCGQLYRLCTMVPKGRPGPLYQQYSLYVFARIVSSHILFITEQTKRVSLDFDEPRLPPPFEENPTVFDVYRLVPEFFLLLERSAGRGGNTLDIFTLTGAGLDMLLTFLMWECDVSLHITFFREIDVFCRWPHALIERHAALFELIEGVKTRAMGMRVDEVQLDVSSAVFRRHFYSFVLDPELDVDLAFVLLLAVGVKPFTDFKERMVIASCLSTPTRRLEEIEMYKKYTETMSIYNSRYTPPDTLTPSKHLKDIVPMLTPPRLVRKIATCSPPRAVPPRAGPLLMEPFASGVAEVAGPTLTFLKWLDACTGCSLPIDISIPAIFGDSASLPIDADNEGNPVFFGQCFYSYE